MISRHFNAIVRVYREPEPEGARDRFGGVDLLPRPVDDAPTAPNARADESWSGTLENRGPGEQQGSPRRWFLDAEMDVRDRDVLLVETGPNAGLKLRVAGVLKATNGPQVHHLEANVEVWDGRLGEDES